MTLKRKRFVNAYLGEAAGNATRAAILAGYSEATATSIGSELLSFPDVQQAIRRRTEKADFSAEDALRELATVAEATPRQIRASDKVSACKLFLQVHGRLKQATSTGVVVNIGFLQRPAETDESPAILAIEASHAE